MSYTIRHCTPNDAELLSAISTRLFLQAYGPTHPEPELSGYIARSFGVDVLARTLRDPAFAAIIAEDAVNSPIAYALTRYTEGDQPSAVGGTRGCEIQRFYVEEAWYGSGLASRLMRTCTFDARKRGADVVWLQVWTKAPRAIAFYKREGFKVVGDATFRFGERVDDDYLMALPVKPSTDL